MTNKLLISLAALLLTTGCGDDEPVSQGAGGSAGQSAGGTAGESSGGSAGSSSTGGTAGMAGAAGTGGTAVGGAAGSAGAGGSAGASGAGGSAGSGGVASDPRLFVSVTDFATATELVALKLDGSKTASLELSDPDSVVSVSGNRAFALERTSGLVHPLDADGNSTGTIDLSGAVPSASSQNPHDVVIAAGSSPLKAYVPLYDSGHLAVLNLDNDTLVKTIDLTGYTDALDTDGGVEPDYAWFDSTRNRVWFTLARIDLSTIVAPDYQLACTGKSLLMAIDASDDSVVDLNGSAAGDGIELLHVGPTSVHYSAADDTLYILSSGCFGSGATERSALGVNAIKLSDLSQTEALKPTGDAFYSTLLWNPDAALIQSFAGFNEEWHSWRATDSALGALVSFVPGSATTDGNGTLYGVDTVSDGTTTTFEVVSVDASNGTRSVLVQNPFTSALSYTSGSAYRP
ncbi:MAG: hypothetical protein R3B07_06375 [Polyangiaceae bacterium]